MLGRFLLRVDWHKLCLRDVEHQSGNHYEKMFYIVLLFRNIRVVFVVYRLFGTSGYCAACSKLIPAFEMIMKAKDNVYHLECFACQRCNQRLVCPSHMQN